MNEHFQREDWTLFRSLSTLSQKAGVPTQKLSALVAKELADNALDSSGACEYGMIGAHGFFIADKGVGIPGSDADIARLFSIGRPLVSSKLLRLPTRGALGNGLRVVVGTVLATGGTLRVSTRGRTLQLHPQDDGTTQSEHLGAWDGEGTRIEVALGAAAGGVVLEWVGQAVLMAEGGSGYKGNTSPFWYDGDAFFELAQAAGERSVRELMASFDGCTGSTAGRVAAAYLNRTASSLTREEAQDLLCTARQIAKPVNPERLGAVGLTGGLPNSYACMTGTYQAEASRSNLTAVIPYMIEAWADLENGPSLNAHVNRTPITGEVQAYHSKTELQLFGCGLSHGIDVGKRAPRLWLNIVTPYMPITSDGKEPDLRAFLPDIRTTIEKAVGKAKRRTGAQMEKKLTEKSVILEHLQTAMDKASGGGVYRFSLRQLYYAVRPYIMELTGNTNPTYENFAAVIRDYESEYGDIAGMYRDPRGVLYHPHLQQEIALGTLAVEKYKRPDWTFNKVLYCEKEGFFAILRAVQWPERHDCALLTAKGYASGAARDVIDLLGDTAEGLQFFCIHDADAYGTMIYQSLQDATKARPARRVRVKNLGLEPDEALRMDLEVERFAREKAAPVAEYVLPSWKQWLQTQRVELNAMTTPQFLAWLDSKFEDESGKVIPSVAVLTDQLEDNVETQVRETLTEQILHEGDFENRVAETLEALEDEVQAACEDIADTVAAVLEDTPQHLWRAPVAGIAKRIVEEINIDASTAT